MSPPELEKKNKKNNTNLDTEISEEESKKLDVSENNIIHEEESIKSLEENPESSFSLSDWVKSINTNIPVLEIPNNEKLVEETKEFVESEVVSSDEIESEKAKPEEIKEDSEETLIWKELIANPDYKGSQRFKIFFGSFFYLYFIAKSNYLFLRHIAIERLTKFGNNYEEKYAGSHFEEETIAIYEDIEWLIRLFSIDIYEWIKYKIEFWKEERRLEEERIYFERVDVVFTFNTKPHWFDKERHKGLPLDIPIFCLLPHSLDYDIKPIRPVIDTIQSVTFGLKDNIILLAGNISWTWEYHFHGTVNLLEQQDIEEVFRVFYKSYRSPDKKIEKLTFSLLHVPDINWKPKYKIEKKLFRHQKFFSKLMKDVADDKDDQPLGHYLADSQDKYEKGVERDKQWKKLIKKYEAKKAKVMSIVNVVVPVAYLFGDQLLFAEDKWKKFSKKTREKYVIAKGHANKKFSDLKVKANNLAVQANSQIVETRKKAKQSYYQFSQQTKSKYEEFLNSIRNPEPAEPKLDENGNPIPSPYEKFEQFLKSSKEYIINDLKDDFVDLTSKFYNQHLKSHVSVANSKFSYFAKYCDFKITRQLDKVKQHKAFIALWSLLTIWQQKEIDAEYVEEYNYILDSWKERSENSKARFKSSRKKFFDVVINISEYIFFIPEQTLIAQVKKLRYLFIYTYLRNCSVDAEDAWGFHPDIPMQRYNFLNRLLFREKYAFYDIFKTLGQNDWAAWCRKLKIYLLDLDPLYQKQYLQSRRILIKTDSFSASEDLFYNIPINRDYDRFLLSDVFSPFDLEVYMEVVCSIPEIAYNYKSYSRLAIMLRDLQALLFGAYWYQMQFEIDSHVYEQLEEVEHLPNAISRVCTVLLSYLTDGYIALPTVPFLQCQKDAHRLINKLRRWLFNWQIRRLKEEQWQHLFTFDNESIHRYWYEWVHYIPEKPPGKTRYLCLGAKYIKLWSCQEDLENFEINLLRMSTQWFSISLWIRNLKPQWILRQPLAISLFTHFFTGFSDLLRVHKKLIQYQRRNMKWYRWWYLYKKKRVRLQVLRHKYLLRHPENFENPSNKHTLMGSCQPKEYLLQLFLFKPEFKEDHAWATTGMENFDKNYREDIYWTNACLWTSEGERVLKAREGKFITNKEMESQLINEISREINAIHTLLNNQDFPIFPLTSEAPSLLIQDGLSKISLLFNKFHITNPRRKIKSTKDIYISNIRSKLVYGLIDFLSDTQVIVDHLSENYMYYTKLKKIFQHKKDYYELYPFMPIYKREFVRYKHRNLFTSMLKSTYIHNSDLMGTHAISEQFEKEHIWDIKGCDNIKRVMEQKIADSIHFTNT